MAVNPMQRKANNSFLLGVLITLLLTGIVIAFLLVQLSNLNKEKDKLIAGRKKIYAISVNVKSGNLITADMLKQIEVNVDAIPKEAIATSSDLGAYSLCDEKGNAIEMQIAEQTNEYTYVLVLSEEDKKQLIYDKAQDRYYYINKTQTINPQTNQAEVKESKVYITFSETPLLAKIDLEANTILTAGMLSRGEIISADVRKQEYNVITLPSQIETGEFIDIRLRLPTGQDYIVVSHKQITIPTINGVDSTNCIWLDLNEVEILNMSGAIVEAYRMNGAKLYATRYIEPGLQDAASITYLPSDEILALMQKDPNAVTEAKNALFARTVNSNEKNVIRNPINNLKNNDDADSNLQSGVQGEIQGLQSEREKYLDSLGN